MKPYDTNNPFYKIVNNIIQTDKLYEDDMFVVINDIQPVAPIHMLVIPKNEYRSYDDFILKASESEILGLCRLIKKMADHESLTTSGYRIITNHMESAGQSVLHFHVHIIGGAKINGLIGSPR